MLPIYIWLLLLGGITVVTVHIDEQLASMQRERAKHVQEDADKLLRSRNVHATWEKGLEWGVQWFLLQENGSLVPQISPLSQCAHCAFEPVVFPRFSLQARYGRFCGEGWSQSTLRPIDDLDQCCHAHDLCVPAAIHDQIECHVNFARCVARSSGKAAKNVDMQNYNAKFAQEVRVSMLRNILSAFNLILNEQARHPKLPRAELRFFGETKMEQVLVRVRQAIQEATDTTFAVSAISVLLAPLTGGWSLMGLGGASVVGFAKVSEVREVLMRHV